MASKNARALVDAAEAAQRRGRPQPPKGYKVQESGFPLRNAGDVLQGVYEGEGKGKRVKKKLVATYLVKREGGGVVELLGTYQLEQFFDGLKRGAKVWIRNDGMVKAGAFGRLVTYTTAVG